MSLEFEYDMTFVERAYELEEALGSLIVAASPAVDQHLIGPDQIEALRERLSRAQRVLKAFRAFGG